jgi:hypothetical protein
VLPCGSPVPHNLSFQVPYLFIVESVPISPSAVTQPNTTVEKGEGWQDDGEDDTAMREGFGQDYPQGSLHAHMHARNGGRWRTRAIVAARIRTA